MKVFLSLLLSLISLYLTGREPDYEHKSISRELNKEFKSQSSVTKVEIDQLNTSEDINGRYFILNNNQKHIGYAYIGRVNSCRTSGCSISSGSEADSHEYFDYLIIYDDSVIIRSVRVFNYQATHGQEICSKGWLKQFYGYSGSQTLSVGEDVDAISGATISVHAITFNIEKTTYALNSYFKNKLAHED